MTGRERIIKAIRLEEVDQTPWVPFIGVHGASLIGVSADEYLKNVDHIVAGVSRGAEMYKADGVPVVFDLQVEAETFGCELKWSPDSPPAVVSHPLSAAGGRKLSDLRLPTPDSGRLPICLEAARRLRTALPEQAIYGLVTGPFTLAIHLLGTDIFMQMFDDPGAVSETLAFCRDVCCAVSGYYMETGCDVIAVVDPMTSQIGPEQFRQFVSPAAEPLFAHIREQGALGSFFVCGQAEQNLQVMCNCRPDNISVDENINLEVVKSICLQGGCSFGGNLQLTTVLLLGNKNDAQRNALECMETAGDKGFILAPGCDLPLAVPPENLVAIAEVLNDEYAREVALAQEATGDLADLLDMTEYGSSDKVIVDVITLDSEACAPCQYMVESVRSIAPEFEGVVEWREHKIKKPESLVFMSSLMVRNIPTICIDGRISFVSRIPPRDELIEAIQKRIIQKLRLRMTERRGEVFLLCSPDHSDRDTVQTLQDHVDRACTELGVDVPVKVVDDNREIEQFGVLPSQTPAVVTAKFKLRSTRMVPAPSVVREWIKDLR